MHNTKNLTPIEQIKEAKKFLHELQDSVRRIIECDPVSFDEGELGICLKELQEVSEESAQRLARPSLRIATIGTTSSGKSTLVNAMIGRRLAPMEADEMSAGILTFLHSERSHLVVELAPEGTWEGGEWSDLDDDDIYLRLGAREKEHGYDGIMTAYHKKKKKRSHLNAPRIRIEAPLLPVLWPNLLRLPDGVQFEILDLPGLKNVDDRKNLQVIQEQVKNAFSLVVLDYKQTDDQSRGELLKELKEVVEAMQGKTDTMLFVLNKVNERNANDRPLEHKLNELKQEIAEALCLDNHPELLPINALLLYYVQCAWGPDISPNPLNEKYSHFLEDCFDDCATTIRKKRKEDKEIKKWFNRYEDEIENLPEEEFRGLIRWAHEWSDGGELWLTLQQNVAERFPELVIYPSIMETLTIYDKFAAQTVEMVKIRKLNTREQIENERKKINGKLKNLRSQLEDRKQVFQDNIKDALDELKKNNTEATNKAINILGNPPGFQALIKAIDDVRLDLFETLIDPVREGFKSDCSGLTLREHIKDYIPERHTYLLANSYEEYKKFMTPTAAKDGITIEAKKGDRDEEKQQNNVKKRCQALYQRMRESLSHRAEFVLQTKAQDLEGAVISLFRCETDKITELAKDILGNSQEIKAILPTFESMSLSTHITLPEKFFDLPDPVKKEDDSRYEFVGTEKYTYTTSSCFGTKEHTDYRNKYDDVSYSVLQLPNADKMAEQWNNGIEKTSNNLWKKLTIWIEHIFEIVENKQSISLTRAENFFEQEFNKQIRILEEKGKVEIEKWKKITQCLQEANKFHSLLNDQAISTKRGV